MSNNRFVRDSTKHRRAGVYYVNCFSVPYIIQVSLSQYGRLIIGQRVVAQGRGLSFEVQPGDAVFVDTKGEIIAWTEVFENGNPEAETRNSSIAYTTKIGPKSGEVIGLGYDTSKFQEIR